jgi:hypothetical protein
LIAIVSDHPEHRQVVHQPQVNRAHLQHLLFLPKSSSIVRLIHRRSSPPR